VFKELDKNLSHLMRNMAKKGPMIKGVLL